MKNKKQKVCITCAQFETVTADIKTNCSRIISNIDKAVSQYPDSDLVLLPELALNGNEYTPDEAQEMAQYIDGPLIKEIAAYAAERKVYLVFGFVERDKEDKELYNTAVLIDNRGNTIGSYRKMHLVESEHEKLKPGNLGYPVFDTEIGRIGIMICWDTAFVETARALALKGADYILIPSAWESPMQKDWDLVHRARAFDNVIYTAACNRVGHARTYDFFGRSKITNPLGDTVSEVIDDIEGVVSAVVDINENKELRNGYYPLLRDRRSETYSELIK